MNESYQLLYKKFKRNSILNVKEPEDETDKDAIKKYLEKEKQFKIAKEKFLKNAKKDSIAFKDKLADKKKLMKSNPLVKFYKEFIIFPNSGDGESSMKKMFLSAKNKVSSAISDIKLVNDYAEKTEEMAKLWKKNKEFDEVKLKVFKVNELLMENYRKQTKMIPENLYYDLNILIEDNLSDLEKNSEGEKSSILEWIKDDNVDLEQYKTNIAALSGDDGLEYYKIKGYLILKNTIKAKRIKAIKNLERIIDLLNAKLLISLKSEDKKCFDLNKLSYYVHVLMDKNIIGEQKTFMDQILNSIDNNARLKKFMFINYEAMEEKTSKMEIASSSNDQLEALKGKFRDLFLLKTNFMKINTNFQQILSSSTGMDKIKQIMKTMLGGLLLVGQHEIDITFKKFIHGLSMIILSLIPFGTLFSGPVLFLEKKLLALLKSIIYPIISKKFPELINKLKGSFNVLYEQRKYLGETDMNVDLNYFKFENIIKQKIYLEIDPPQGKEQEIVANISSKIIRENYEKLLKKEIQRKVEETKRNLKVLII